MFGSILATTRGSVGGATRRSDGLDLADFLESGPAEVSRRSGLGEGQGSALGRLAHDQDRES